VQGSRKAGRLDGGAAGPYGAQQTPAGGNRGGKQAGDGLDLFYASGLAFVAQPAHAWVTGKHAVRHILGGPFAPSCNCVKLIPGAGPHATWDCPKRYWAVRGQCPGFNPNGERVLEAWNGDELTPATRDAWKAFAATLRKAHGAPGVPAYD